MHVRINVHVAIRTYIYNKNTLGVKKARPNSSQSEAPCNAGMHACSH